MTHDDIELATADLLAAFEARLAAGGVLEPAAERELSPEQQEVFRLACEGLQQLEGAWPRTPRGDAECPADAPSYDVLAGTGRVGKYIIRRELGRGGSGIVFLATDTAAGRDVALKLPQLEALIDPDLRRRFLDEARLAIGLDHPGLVPVFEAGEVGAVCYIASAYAGEMTLADWLETRLEPVPVRTAAALLATMARAVEYLHSHHVLHRDIKPSNILLGRVAAAALPDPELAEPGVPLLTDFGLAQLLDIPAPSSDASGTTGGLVLGTAEYMAPEQAEAHPERLTRAADVYALGAVLYELITGQPPLRGRNKFDTLRKVLAEEPVRPRRVRRGVPSDLEAVCLKCLEKSPSRRYASTGELADDLQRYLAGQRTLARPPQWWRPAWRWMKRRPALALSLLFATLLAVGFAVALDSHTREMRRVQVSALHAALYTTDAARLRPVIDQLRGHLPLVGEELRREFDDEQTPHHKRFRAALVLAPESDGAAAFLRDEIPEASLSDLRLACDALSLRWDRNAADWMAIARDHSARPGRRLRAAVVLARVTDASEFWSEDGRAIAALLAAESPFTVLGWAELLGPVKGFLIPWLRERFHNPAEGASARWVASALLAEFYADSPADVVELLCAADGQQFANLFARLRHFRDIIPRLEALLEDGFPPHPVAAGAGIAHTHSVDTAGGTRVPVEQRDKSARTQANLSLALLRLGRPTAVCERLHGDTDPRVRYHLIHGLRPLHTHADAPAPLPSDVSEVFSVLLGEARKGTQPDAVRASLLLAVAEYTPDVLADKSCDEVIHEARRLYEIHPDVGVHSAAQLLLRRWRQRTAAPRQSLDVAEARCSSWYTTRDGATLAIIRPPTDTVVATPKGVVGLPSAQIKLSPFAIGTTEVTVEEYRRVPGVRLPQVEPQRPGDCPVSDISFVEAAEYCNWLSAREGLPLAEYCYEVVPWKGRNDVKTVRVSHDRTGYRLPTEAEWEYACRGGTHTCRYFGEGPEYLPRHAWFYDNSHGRSRQVALLTPNAWGIFDAYGNVSEWCVCSWDGGPTYGVLRGGSWQHTTEGLRSDSRAVSPQPYRATNIGFRVGRTLRK